MAYHHKRHHHNPWWLPQQTAVYVFLGAAGATAIPRLIGLASRGWTGVLSTGASALGISFLVNKFFGPIAAAETLKGGLAATGINAFNQAMGGTLGLYAPSWFGIPTASSQYLQAASGNMPGFNRGGGTILFPGPGVVPAAAQSRLGYHRFRSRYAGNYG